MSGTAGVTRDRWDEARARSVALAAAWRRGPEHRRLVALFDGVAAEDAAVAREQALALLKDDGWAGALIAPLIAALARDPLTEPPLRVSRSAGRIGAVLLETRAVRIGCAVQPAVALVRAPRQVVMSGRVQVTRYVRAGGARLRRWRAEAVSADFSADRAAAAAELAPRALSDGDVVVVDGRTEGAAAEGANGNIVTLNVIVNAGADPLTREYDCDDGRLLRVASSDEESSRTALLLTLLRLQDRRDAAPVFDQATHDRAFHARWQAMREWLALDAQAALPRLSAMATDDPHHEVRAAATATLALVRERVPA